MNRNEVAAVINKITESAWCEGVHVAKTLGFQVFGLRAIDAVGRECSDEISALHALSEEVGSLADRLDIKQKTIEALKRDRDEAQEDRDEGTEAIREIVVACNGGEWGGDAPEAVGIVHGLVEERDLLLVGADEQLVAEVAQLRGWLRAERAAREKAEVKVKRLRHVADCARGHVSWNPPGPPTLKFLRLRGAVRALDAEDAQ